MRIEHRMREERRRAHHTWWKIKGEPFRRAIDRRCLEVVCGGKRGHNRLDVADVRGFVERYVDPTVGSIPEIHARRQRRLSNPLRPLGGQPQGVEVNAVELSDADLHQLPLEQPREAMHAPREGRQSCRAVIDGVEPGDVRQERLRCADIRRRPLASDVLLAGL